MATSNKTITEEEWQMLRDIGQIYKDLRKEWGISQAAAAKHLGTSQARVPVLENGQADVMVTTLSRWANVYGHKLSISLVPYDEDELLSEDSEN